MLHNQPAIAGAQSPSGQDVLLILETIELHTNRSCCTKPADKDEGEEHQDNRRNLVSQIPVEQNEDDRGRNFGENLANTFHHQINFAAIIALDGTINGTE